MKNMHPSKAESYWANRARERYEGRPATSKQIKMLLNLKLDWRPGMTMKQASDAIRDAVALGKRIRYFSKD